MLISIADQFDAAIGLAQESLKLDVNDLDEKLSAYQDRLLTVEARRQQLLWVVQLTEYGQILISKIPAANRAKLPGPDAAILERNSPARLDSLHKTERELFELQLAVRLKRFDFGIGVIRRTTGQLTKERFLAAFTTELDGRILLETLRPP